MSAIRITTLSPVHIGSGLDYDPLSGYAYFPNEGCIALVNDQKIFDLLQGKQQDIEDWIRLINQTAHHKKESKDAFRQWLERKAGRSLKPTDVGDLILDYHPSANNAPITTQALKAGIRSGNGRAIIPGSSLKGSMRTAFFASKIPEKLSVTDYQERGKFKGDSLEARYLSPYAKQEARGERPTHDLFRFVRFSDFAFETTDARICRVVSEIDQQEVKERSDLDNLLECIPAGQKALGRLQLPAQQIALNIAHNILPKQAAIELERASLFRMANAYMRGQLEKELSRLKGKSEPAHNYHQQLEDLLHIIEGLGDRGCVLRLGAGSGFLFTTGGWQEDRMDTANLKQLAKEARHGRYKNDKLPFPRSRKYLSGKEVLPLGFVLVEYVDEAVLAQEREVARAQEAARIQAEKEQREREQKERELKEKAEKEAAETKLRLTPMPAKLKTGTEVEVRIEGPLAGKPRWASVTCLRADGIEKAAKMSGFNALPEDAGKIVFAHIQKMGFDGKSPDELSFKRLK